MKIPQPIDVQRANGSLRPDARTPLLNGRLKRAQSYESTSRGMVAQLGDRELAVASTPTTIRSVGRRVSRIFNSKTDEYDEYPSSLVAVGTGERVWYSNFK